jgi:trans-aconitate 2-methyltransferase
LLLLQIQKKILEDIGFKNIQVNLIKKIASFQNYQDYILFMKTVVIKPYLSYLPTNNNNKIKNLFTDEFFCELDKKNNRTTIDKTTVTNFEIDYVRLNITGTK